MHDLNLNLFYKTSFEIRTIDQDGDALWCLVCSIRAWMTGKWKAQGIAIPATTSQWSQFKTGATITSSDDNKTVRLYSDAYWDSAGPDYWACSITETVTVPNRAPRQWVTEIGFASMEPSSGTVSIVLSYGDRPGFLGECQDEPSLTIPGIIKRLMTNKELVCESCGMPLELEPRQLHAGEFSAFWDVVMSPERNIPVVYISPKKYDVEGLLAIDPGDVADALGPSALVYYALDPAFNGEMRAKLPKAAYKCLNGFVRVYAPHPRLGDKSDPARHRFFSPSVIEDYGDKEFIGILRRALAQDVQFYEDMVRLDVVKSKVRRASIAKRAQYLVKDAEARATAAEEDTFALLVELEEENDFIEKENVRLEQELSEERANSYSLKARAEAAEDALMGRKQSSALDEIDMRRYSPRMLVDLFTTIYSERIDLTERAVASLDDCNTRPDILWDALYDLCTLAYDLHRDPRNLDIAKEFNARSEFEYARGAGMMTRKDSGLMEQYRDVYQGREIEVETHLKKGNKPTSDLFVRIYFAFDKKTQRIVVSYLGKHLDNYTTRSIH